jgi:hypothetical protein
MINRFGMRARKGDFRVSRALVESWQRFWPMTYDPMHEAVALIYERPRQWYAGLYDEDTRPAGVPVTRWHSGPLVPIDYDKAYRGGIDIHFGPLTRDLLDARMFLCDSKEFTSRAQVILVDSPSRVFVRRGDSLNLNLTLTHEVG